MDNVLELLCNSGDLLSSAAIVAGFSVFLFFFVPGYLIFTLFCKQGLSLKKSEIMLISIVISTSITSIIGTLLAEIGYFSLDAVFFSILSICIPLAIVRYRKGIGLNIRPIRHEILINYESAALFLVLAASAALLLIYPPVDWIFGTFDPGIYINNGVNIAKTGAIFHTDPLIRSINSDEILVHGLVNQGLNGFGIHGYDLVNPKEGIFLPVLFHLFPVWIAILYSILGMEGATYTSSIFGILGLLTVFMVARLITNWKVATIASVLLMTNFIQIYFTRTSFTEGLTQFFIFGGIFLYIIGKKNSNKYLAVFAALPFALSMFLRIDSYILLGPFVLYFTYLKLSRRLERTDLYFINTFSILAIYNLIHTNFFSKHYAIAILLRHFDIDNLVIATENLIFPMLILFLLVFIALINTNFHPLSELVRKKVRGYYQRVTFPIDLVHYSRKNQLLILSYVITIFTIYCWCIRPLDGPFTSDAYNLVKLTWFISPIVLFCGICGLLVMLNEKMHSYHELFVVVFLSFYTILAINVLDYPDLPYMMRRYLPIVIPSIMIFASLFMYEVIERAPRGKKIVSIVVIGVVMLTSCGYLQDSTLLQEKMWDGAIETADQISKFTADDILIISDGEKDPFLVVGHLVASPLKFIYDKKVIYVDTDDQKNLEKILFMLRKHEDVQKGNVSVYLVNCNISSLDVKRAEIDPVYVRNFSITRDSIERTVDRKPSKIMSLERPLEVYLVVWQNIT